MTSLSTAPVRTTNGLAVAALVLGILGWSLLPFAGSIGAIVLGHMARARIARSAGTQDGDGLALAGLLLGWIAVGTWIAGAMIFLLFFGGLALMAGHAL